MEQPRGGCVPWSDLARDLSIDLFSRFVVLRKVYLACWEGSRAIWGGKLSATSKCPLTNTSSEYPLTDGFT